MIIRPQRQTARHLRFGLAFLLALFLKAGAILSLTSGPSHLVADTTAPTAASTGKETDTTNSNSDPDSDPDNDETTDSLQGRMREILSAPEFRRVRINIEEHEIRTPQKTENEPVEKKEASELPSINPDFSAAAPAIQVIGTGMIWLVWGLIGLVCAVMIFLIVRAFFVRENTMENADRPTPRFEQGEALPAPGELTGDHYTREARKLAEQGLFREAIGQLVLGLMGYTEQAGLIRFRNGLTHRDYLRAQQPKPTLRESFRKIVRLYEPICFGRRPAHADDFEQSLAQYLAILSDA